MARRTKHPVNAEVITEYEQLRFFAKKFGQGMYNCLIFIGPPGRLKSNIIETEAKGNAHLISGHATPFEVFCEAQEHKDEALIIDDADGLYSAAQGQRLLKSLTNPKIPKRVSWTSDAPTQRGLLKVFETTSKVCIIDNAWNAQNEHIAALEDRSRLIYFSPSPSEVHQEMYRQDWFADDEIYSFIGDNISVFSELSVRTYVKSFEAKQAGEDWRSYILNGCVNTVDREVIMLEYDEVWKDKGSNAKAEEFLRRTGYTARASYFNRRNNIMDRFRRHPLVGKWSQQPTE